MFKSSQKNFLEVKFLYTGNEYIKIIIIMIIIYYDLVSFIQSLWCIQLSYVKVKENVIDYLYMCIKHS